MKANSSIKGKRKPWIDIAKGILILIVLLGHVQYFAHDFVGIDEFKFVEDYHILFITWYMPAFFVITGYCTNFEVQLQNFFVKNLKSLIVPSILIGVFLATWTNRFFSIEGLNYQNFLDYNYISILMTCGPWFLTALFVSKMFTFIQHRYVKWRNDLKILFSIMLMLVGTALYNKHLLPNIWYFQHAMLLQPFMLAGVLLRNYRFQFNKREKIYSLTLGGAFLLIAILMKVMHLPYPYIIGIPGVFWGNFWLCVLMGLSGSMALFVICQKIGKCKWLEFLGRHTLTIYLLQESIMVLIIKIGIHYHIAYPNMLIVLAFIFSTAFVCAWIDVFIDRHLEFLKGKF